MENTLKKSQGYWIKQMKEEKKLLENKIVRQFIIECQTGRGPVYVNIGFLDMMDQNFLWNDNNLWQNWNGFMMRSEVNEWRSEIVSFQPTTNFLKLRNCFFIEFDHPSKKNSTRCFSALFFFIKSKGGPNGSIFFVIKT